MVDCYTDEEDITTANKQPATYDPHAKKSEEQARIDRAAKKKRGRENKKVAKAKAKTGGAPAAAAMEAEIDEADL
eukprot:12507698-Prorocentrum_lima.AAC.1